MKRTIFTSLIVMAFCLQIACTDKQLQQSNKYLVDYAASITVIEKTVIDLDTKQLIPRATTRKILGITDRANKAGIQIKNILGAISKVDPASKAQIIGILDAASAELDPTTIAEIAGINNPQTRVSIESGLTAVRTVITSIRIAIGG